MDFIENYEERGNEFLSLFKILMEEFIVCSDPKNDMISLGCARGYSVLRVEVCSGLVDTGLLSAVWSLKGACLGHLVF